MPNKNEKNWRSVIFSLKIKKEKSKTNIGEVKSPAPASAIGIMGITPKYRSMATTLKNVRTRTAFQFFGINCSLAIDAKIKTARQATIDREKWNWPTLT